jgi:hypothetical protein
MGTSALEISVEEWMSVLKLCKKWNLTSMQSKAVTQSDAQIKNMSAVEKIQLAKKYDVRKWLEEGVKTLAMREDSITVEERDKLGWESYGMIMDVREKCRKWVVSDTSENSNYYCSNCGNYHHSTICNCIKSRMVDKSSRFNFEDAIRKTFDATNS